MTNQAYQAMFQYLDAAQNLLITGHVDPDADCIGSMLGLYYAFAGAEKGWQLVLQDPVPYNLAYLPGVELIRTPAQIGLQPSAILLVDCGDLARAGAAWLEPYSRLPLYCIDHHVSNNFTGTLAVLEAEASSTGEIVAAICEDAGKQAGLEMATCLYSAIVSDTGCFRYLNTTPRCMEIGARLLRCGVDLEDVRIHLFESRSRANVAMLAVALTNVDTLCEGRLCYTFVRYSDMLEHGAQAVDLHNIINYTLSIVGVKLGILFEEHETYVKISLRSRRGIRVDRLAVELGGGGHMMAAGCRLEGRLEEVMPRVLEKARALLEG